MYSVIATWGGRRVWAPGETSMYEHSVIGENPQQCGWEHAAWEFVFGNYNSLHNKFVLSIWVCLIAIFPSWKAAGRNRRQSFPFLNIIIDPVILFCLLTYFWIHTCMSILTAFNSTFSVSASPSEGCCYVRQIYMCDYI